MNVLCCDFEPVRRRQANPLDVTSIVEVFADLKIRIRFGEGTLNIKARDDIKIIDVGPIVTVTPCAAKEFAYA